MAQTDNPGQFGVDGPDTKAAAQTGGEHSTGKFGSPKGADPSAMGHNGAMEQDTKDKSIGGQHQHSHD